MLLMKIRTIKKDDSELTLSIPLSILPSLIMGRNRAIYRNNLFNCWELSLRQSAAKPFIKEGSTTIEKVTNKKYISE